jgi:hypothetical protein
VKIGSKGGFESDGRQGRERRKQNGKRLLSKE